MGHFRKPSVLRDHMDLTSGCRDGEDGARHRRSERWPPGAERHCDIAAGDLRSAADEGVKQIGESAVNHQGPCRRGEQSRCGSNASTRVDGEVYILYINATSWCQIDFIAMRSHPLCIDTIEFIPVISIPLRKRTSGAAVVGFGWQGSGDWRLVNRVGRSWFTDESKERAITRVMISQGMTTGES